MVLEVAHENIPFEDRLISRICGLIMNWSPNRTTNAMGKGAGLRITIAVDSYRAFHTFCNKCNGQRGRIAHCNCYWLIPCVPYLLHFQEFLSSYSPRVDFLETYFEVHFPQFSEDETVKNLKGPVTLSFPYAVYFAANGFWGNKSDTCTCSHNSCVSQ